MKMQKSIFNFKNYLKYFIYFTNLQSAAWLSLMFATHKWKILILITSALVNRCL